MCILLVILTCIFGIFSRCQPIRLQAAASVVTTVDKFEEIWKETTAVKLR
jgi:hypothetical protein